MRKQAKRIALWVGVVASVVLIAALWRAGPPDGRWTPARAQAGPACEDHHDREQHPHAPRDESESGDHGHGHEPHAERVKLTDQQMRKFGIELGVAGPGEISRIIRLPGEIVINADSAARIVPPAGGVVREVRVKVGDRVSAGDAMAVLESAGLSQARTEYLVAWNEQSCCRLDLDRAEAIRNSTRKLLDLLARSPSLEELRRAKFAEVDENHSKLISAYAAVVLAEAGYEREKRLLDQNATSRAEFEAAETACKKALADYVATRDSLAFRTQRALLEAQRCRQDTELAVRSAERKLRVLGLSDEDVSSLRQAMGRVRAEQCADPDCAGCRAIRAQPATVPKSVLDEDLGLYSLRAPFSGTVIEKRIVLGEKLSDDVEVFTVADMSTVWADLSLSQKDLPHVLPGRPVRIHAGPDMPEAAGDIAYVSPIVDARTRTGRARVVLANPTGALRPGLFVTAEVSGQPFHAGVLVPADAVQRLGEEQVVFVPTPEGLTARGVRIGRRTSRQVEIVSGLNPGEPYVVRGAFELKAEIVIRGMGGHAGHGH
ncbi:MAG: efflux RND transporter periplasmic adaptor subunit [Planctomycetota bacterium]|jgi:multidrug efflux pump subunit AcrA (membrane-fusion protein)